MQQQPLQGVLADKAVYVWHVCLRQLELLHDHLDLVYVKQKWRQDVVRQQSILALVLVVEEAAMILKNIADLVQVMLTCQT